MKLRGIRKRLIVTPSRSVSLRRYLKGRDQKGIYTLKSMVCHQGKTSDTGHYYAYACKKDRGSPDGVIWLRLDDVKRPSIKKVRMPNTRVWLQNAMWVIY